MNVTSVFGSILLVQLAVIGGLGWVSGVGAGAIVVGGGLLAVIVQGLFPDLSDVTEWLTIVSGIAVIQIIWQAPDGLAAKLSRSPIGRFISRLRVPREASLEVEKTPSRLRRAASLEIEGITVRFGGVLAVDNVSFHLSPGEIVGMIGPNGAGKTTLLDVITGFTRSQQGRVRLDDVNVSSWTPERRARAGMARSWQAVELFEEMTVRENLLVGSDRHVRRRYFTDLIRPGNQGLTEVSQNVIDDFGLTSVLNMRPSALPQGHARLVGIARAIAGEPAVLLLDEPAAGLGPDESAELATAILSVVNRLGIGVLIVEHDVPFLQSICNRIVALDFGQKVAEGTPAEVSSDERVIRAYLGEPDGIADLPQPEVAKAQV